MMKKILALSVLLAMPVLATAGPGDWAYQGAVDGPLAGANGIIGGTRLAVDSNNTVYVAGGNGTVEDSVFKSTDFFAAITASPMVAPIWSTLITDATQANGFQGLAIDASDNLFTSSDEAADPGRIDKWAADGTPDATITDITPSVRICSAAMLSDGNLLVNSFGGVFIKVDASTGAELATVDSATGNFLRDIAIKPDTASGNDVIFGMHNGNLVSVTGGTAADISGYTTVTDFANTITNTDTSWQVRPALCYFAGDDTVIYTNYQDVIGTNPGALYVVSATDGTVYQTIDADTVAALGGVSDVVAFSEGSTDYMLVVSADNSGVQVYTKSNTTDVSDWTILD